jgi:hypothetical protein
MLEQLKIKSKQAGGGGYYRLTEQGLQEWYNLFLTVVVAVAWIIE